MNDRLPRLAVTGANGFLGSALCRLAAQSGYEVVAVVRRPCPFLRAAEVVVTPLTDLEPLANAFSGCDAVIHTAGLAHVFGRAAHDEQAFHSANVRSTEVVATAAIKSHLPHLVLASSVSVYGDSTPGGVKESQPPHPLTAYARSKWAAEQAAHNIFSAHGCLSTLRLATLYGEGDRGNVAKLVASLRRGFFMWPGSGQNRKSLVYRDDAARACLAAVNAPAAGTYNISADPAMMRDIINAICDALQRPVPPLRIPGYALQVAQNIAAHVPALQSAERRLRTFLNDDVYSGYLFRERFGWQPQVSLKEGLARQVRAGLSLAARGNGASSMLS